MNKNNNNKALINFMIDEMVVLRQTIEKLQQDNKKLQEEIKIAVSSSSTLDLNTKNIEIVRPAVGGGY